MVKDIAKIIGEPNWITIRTEGEIISHEYFPDQTYGDGIQIDLKISEKQTDIYLSSPRKSVEWVILRWNEKYLSDGKVFGDTWERGYGNLEWKGASAYRCLPWYLLTEYVGGFLGIGVMTNPSAMCFWQIDTSGITLYLDVRCGGDGVMLGKRKLKMCSAIQRVYETHNAYEAAREFCRAMCPNPLFPRSTVYGSNNWYYTYGDTSHEEVLRDAEYIVRLTKNCSERPYMILDDGWQVSHKIDEYNGGPWRQGNEKFPNMKLLADQIKEIGANPGIWIRPLFDQMTDFPKEWKLANGIGLDPSCPGVMEHIKEDIKTICEWGYKLIKYDFMTYDLFAKWGFEMNPAITENGWHFYNRGLTSAEIVKMMYEEIYKTAEPYDVVLLGCNAIGHLGAGYMHINRVGDDISGKEWERTRKMGINSLAFRLCQNETFYITDADCVGITDKISWELNKQWADVIARSGTALFVSVDPKVLNDLQNKELSSILELASENKHRTQPIDWMTNNCPDTWLDDEKIIEYNWYEKTGLNFVIGPNKEIVELPGA